jgi:HEAT repeat protein
LIGLLKKVDPFGAEYAALLRTIERLGVDKSYLPMLVQDLKSEDNTTGVAAVRLLGMMGEPCLAEVLKLLEHRAQPIRHRAASVLIHLHDVPVARLIPALVKRLKDEDCNVRLQAGLTLANLKGNIKPAMPALLESLAAGNMGAALALGRIGSGAREAVPALREALADTTTCTTIMWLDSSDVTQKKVQRHTIAEYAAAALGSIGAEARAAVPDLIKSLSSPLPGLRLRAAAALSEIAPGDANNARAVYHLFAVTQSRKEQTQLLDVLAKMDQHAVGYLVLVLKNGGTVIKVEAMGRLSRIGSGAKNATGDLTTTLKNNDAEVRTSAAKALGEIGTGAKSALSISYLRVQARSDRNIEAREAAQAALAKIEK